MRRLPEFKIKQYGYSSYKNFFTELGIYELVQTNNKTKDRALRIPNYINRQTQIKIHQSDFAKPKPTPIVVEQQVKDEYSNYVGHNDEFIAGTPIEPKPQQELAPVIENQQEPEPLVGVIDQEMRQFLTDNVFEYANDKIEIDLDEDKGEPQQDNTELEYVNIDEVNEALIQEQLDDQNEQAKFIQTNSIVEPPPTPKPIDDYNDQVEFIQTNSIVEPPPRNQARNLIQVGSIIIERDLWEKIKKTIANTPKKNGATAPNIPMITSRLQKAIPSFSVRHYGYGTLRTFLKASQQYSLAKTKNGYTVRLKYQNSNSSNAGQQQNKSVCPTYLDLDVFHLIQDLIRAKQVTPTSFVKMKQIEDELAVKMPEFDPKKYGYVRLLNILKNNYAHQFEFAVSKGSVGIRPKTSK